MRLEIARARGVPPYVIFHDTTLREMARLRPTTLDALRAVYGVGARKADDLGEQFIQAIREHTYWISVRLIVIVGSRGSRTRYWSLVATALVPTDQITPFVVWYMARSTTIGTPLLSTTVPNRPLRPGTSAGRTLVRLFARSGTVIWIGGSRPSGFPSRRNVTVAVPSVAPVLAIRM